VPSRIICLNPDFAFKKLTKGDNYFQMNNINGLPDGTYYLNAIVDNKLISKKLVIGMQ